MENRDNVISMNPRAAQLGWSHGRFNFPHEVVRDPALSAQQKREVLSAWASDRHAIESLPSLRHLPGTPFPVTFGSIMDARAELDRMDSANDDEPPPPPAAVRHRSVRAAALTKFAGLVLAPGKSRQG